MDAFTHLNSTFAPLANNDVDTDQIIPAVYLKVTDKNGLVEGLFQRWRVHEDGSLNEDFFMNKPEYRQAKILLAGDNFGCGSSREHAPWALVGWGFQAVISTSFADIFKSNSLKNGLLPIEVDEQTHQVLFDIAEETRVAELKIDLAEQTLELPDGSKVSFPIDGFSKLCLLEGVDQLGYLQKRGSLIEAYETQAGK
jgi:3-isopropylmalate/(R)-2-methylmalate dehydratase small subunit